MIDKDGNGVVVVKKDELLAVMKENRGNHRAIFEKAIEGYRAEVTRYLETMLAEVKAGKRIRTKVELVQPIDQTKDYDRVIRMLEMSVDAEVRITESEFAMYVQDDWSWKAQFTASTMGYVDR